MTFASLLLHMLIKKKKASATLCSWIVIFLFLYSFHVFTGLCIHANQFTFIHKQGYHHSGSCFYGSWFQRACCSITSQSRFTVSNPNYYLFWQFYRHGRFC